MSDVPLLDKVVPENPDVGEHFDYDDVVNALRKFQDKIKAIKYTNKNGVEIPHIIPKFEILEIFNEVFGVLEEDEKWVKWFLGNGETRNLKRKDWNAPPVLTGLEVMASV